VQVELGDVVEEDEEGEEDDADEGYLVDDFLELLVDVTAHDAFDDEEEDHASVEQREGHQVEDAEVERDDADQVEQRPDTHLRGDVDLLGDADRAHHLIDGDVAGEETLEDAEDQHGAFAIVLEGLLHGLADGEALDVGRWGTIGEAEAVLIAGAGRLHLLGGCYEGDGLAVAQDAEGVGCSLVVLEEGEQGVDGVEVKAVEAGHLVAGLEACSGGGGVGRDGEDADRAGIHAGDEADGDDVVEAELAVGGSGDGEGGGARLAVVDEGDGEGTVEVEGGLLEDLIPGGVRDAVEAGDGVAGGEAVRGRGGSLGNVVDDGGAVEVLVDFVVIVGDQEEQEERQDEVEDRPGDGDEDALPAGLGGEVVGRGSGREGGLGSGLQGSPVAAELAGHLDVAAEGEDGDAIVGIAVAEAEDAGSEADGEGFHADAAELGDDEVAELVDENEEAEDDGEFNNDEEDMHAD
jgi:hypothetical protein